MKKIILGMVIGCTLTASTMVAAEDGMEKVTAFLRNDLPITLNGQKVALDSAPIMYDGSTYLKLRDVAKITGVDVGWNDSTQTVELSSVTTTTEQKDGDSTVADTARKKKILQGKIELAKDELECAKSELQHFISWKGDYIKEFPNTDADAVQKEKEAAVTKAEAELQQLEDELAKLQ